jgi:outer membrane protein insertion porin family
MRVGVLLASILAVAGADGASASAQTLAPISNDPRLCGQPVPAAATLPPADSGPVVYMLGLCFAAQGNVSSIEAETYLYYIHLRPSRPSMNDWVPYDEQAHDTLLSDFRRLWGTGFLDDLSIEADDYVFANGVVGKVITFQMEERARIKLVQYDARDIDRTKVEEALKDKGVTLALDSFLDQSAIARAKGVLRDMMRDKGFTNADVSHTITPVAGGPKLVNVIFHVNGGPRTVLRDVQFLGNRAVPDAPLRAAMKGTRSENLLSFATGAGRYNDTAFADDAQAVEEYYRDRGYINARVGQPELRPLQDAANGQTRWMQLRIPVVEGAAYRVGTITIDGNQVVKTEALRALFKVSEGDIYSQRLFRDGVTKARELYGAGGYMEFTAFPDLRPRTNAAASNVVDVVIRVTEGERYTVHRLTFTGNTTTRDNVIRREMQIAEGGVFSTEALKYSVQRLNQLGYFKPVQGNDKDLTVEKTPGIERAVDVTVKVEEQNRNQMQFGAGMSQYEGLFGNLSFTTTNFLGRGESVTISGQKGSRSNVYQLAFTEPYVFSRPMSTGINLYSRKNDYLTGTNTLGYSEVRSGSTFTAGYPIFRFTRLFMTYGYEVIDTAVSRTLSNSLDKSSSVGVPVFDPLLDEGRHTESKVSPQFVYNTVNNPFAPRSGMKIDLSLPVAGGPFGGTTSYVRPELEAVLYIPHTRRTAFGLRATGGFVRPFGSTHALPYYLRYFLGGENQIRGVNIRTVGPTDASNRAIGGDRFVLFNAEYYFDIAGPVRALLFHDAGQAYSERQHFDLRRLRTSSGAELRVVLPMLNVPFRLIYAWNIYRDSFQPNRTLKFAVGTTF